jgi:predicted nucleic acid-binding protein
MIVMLDTMAVIFGIQRTARPGQEHLVKCMSEYLDRVRAKRPERSATRMAVSSIVQMEYLRGFPAVDQVKELDTLRRRVIVLPFDAKAAAVAARLHADRERIKQIRDEHAVLKGTIEADVMIVATAIASGAGTLISHNGRLRRFQQIAGDELRIIDIPSTEADLFG